MRYHFEGRSGGGRLCEMEVVGHPVWGFFRVWCATCGLYGWHSSPDMKGDALALARALNAETKEQHRCGFLATRAEIPEGKKR